MPQSSPRYAALDVFRGLTIFVMIVVNTPGAGSKPWPLLEHADWFGFTLADFVFPSFLFAMGAALVFTMQKAQSDRQFLAHAFKRAALLFAIGYLMFWYPFVKVTPDLHYVAFPFENTRLLGVLQRLGLCYALAAIAVRFLTPKQVALFCIALLAGTAAAMVFLVEPGMAYNKLNNLGSLIDRAVIPASHIYRGDGGFEPEGLLGTLPATVNVLAGYLTCRFLLTAQLTLGRVQKLAFAGVGLCIVALFVSAAVPISKKLWTASFALLTIGLDVLLIAALAFALDLVRLPRTGFFEILGKNPLAVYLVSEWAILTLIALRPVFGVNLYRAVGINLVQPLVPGPLGSFLCALGFALLCWLVGYLLYRKRIFVRL